MTQQIFAAHRTKYFSHFQKKKKIIVCNYRFSGPIICFNSAMLTVEYRAQYV